MTKIILASRHGGHATSTPAIKSKIDEDIENPEYIVVTDFEDNYQYNFTEEIYRVPSFRPTGARFYRPLKALTNFYKSWKILSKEKPDKVVVYGANTSFPIGLISSLKNIDVIAVEAENRVKKPSLTPKVLSRLSNVAVWVSHDNLIDQYHTDKVKNREIIQSREFSEYQSETKENNLLVIPSSNDPELQEKYWKDISHEEFLELMGETETVLTRGGMASFEAANLAEKVLVRPSDHAGAHQKNFAEWLSQEYENVEINKDRTFKKLIEEHKDSK
jgi:hypothetical protein